MTEEREWIVHPRWDFLFSRNRFGLERDDYLSVMQEARVLP